MWAGAEKYAPVLLPYLFSFYSMGSAVRSLLPDFIMTMRWGVQQGDPLGSFLFCLGMQHLLSHILNNSPDVLILLYCDDIFLFGTPANIAELYPRLKAALAVGNLKFSPTKQSFFSPSPLTDTSLLTNLGIKECEGVIVLGAPVGPTDFIEEFLDRFFLKYANSLDSLCPLIHDYPHEALTLFTKCILPSTNHIFRCVPTSILQNANFLSNILNRDKAFLLHLLRRPSLYPEHPTVMPCDGLLFTNPFATQVSEFGTPLLLLLKPTWHPGRLVSKLLSIMIVPSKIC